MALAHINLFYLSLCVTSQTSFPRTEIVKDYGAQQAVNICKRDLTAYKKEVDWTFVNHRHF